MQVQTIKIWLKSFIPGDYQFAEVVKGTGKHAGKTMIHLPLPIKSAFLTDQRTFSSDIAAKARMHSELEMDVQKATIVNEVQKCDETTEVDPNTGDEKCVGHGSTDKMKFTKLRVSGKVISVDLEASSANPCAKVASVELAPAQDYFGTLTITPNGNSVTVLFDGKVERFPAYEMYVSVNGGEPNTLFRYPPEKDSTVLDLIGGPGRDVYESVTVTV